MVRHGNVEYNDDGKGFTIYGNPSGLPSATCVVPAPSVNCKDESERQKRFESAIEGCILEGKFIVEQKRIRNTAFDKRDEKTTLQLKIRACKTPDEVNAIHDKIVEILAKRKMK
jgi:hypothetical protein